MSTEKPTNNNPEANVSHDHEAFMQDLTWNLYHDRRKILEKLTDPRRDLNAECGYKSTDELDIDDFYGMYERESIAARVVEVLPMETWKELPKIYEDEDASISTEFEKRFKEVGNKLLGANWMEQDTGSPLWSKTLEADVRSGIGKYGVILLGISDGLLLEQPINNVLVAEGSAEPNPNPPAKSNLFDLNYIRVFDESTAAIVDVEKNPSSKRYGQPLYYSLTLDKVSSKTVKVHWTRVVHISEGDIIGTPRQLPVWNHLHNLRKTYGGSAEMYWRGAFPGLAIETHPQLGGDVQIDEDKLQEKLFLRNNGLQRDLWLMGMTAKSIAPQVVSPDKHIDVYLEAICIKLAIPKRIFMGSERGELASSQDSDTWDDRLHSRRTGYVTDNIIGPLINRLIACGVLPIPADGYRVKWDKADRETPKTKSEIAVRRTDAIVKYVKGDGQSLMAEIDFLTRELGYTDEEAKSILENRDEFIIEVEDDSDLPPDPTAPVPPKKLPSAKQPSKLPAKKLPAKKLLTGKKAKPTPRLAPAPPKKKSN